MGKRIGMHVCPACSASVIEGDSHGPADDLVDIRARDAAYSDKKGFDPLDRQLNNGDLNPAAQKAADRRMLLRMLDHELERIGFALNREPHGNGPFLDDYPRPAPPPDRD